MEHLLLAVVILVVLGLPAIVGMYAVWWNAASSSEADTTHPPTNTEVYRRGLKIAKTPAVLLFVPLALAGIYVQLSIGYAGGPPPWPIMLGRLVGVTLVLAVYIGGLTVAGTVLAVYIRRLRSEGRA